MSIVDGQFYINNLNGDYYLRENGAWVLRGNIESLGFADVLGLVQPGDTDQTAALARAIATGKPIMFRYNGGTPYVISARQTVPANTAIFGFGGRAVISMAVTGQLFLMNAVSGVRIKDLKVIGNKAAVTAGPPIDFEGASDCVLDDCDFTDCSREIRLFAGTNNVRVRRVSYTNSGQHGLQIDNSFNNTVSQFNVNGSVGFGIILTGGSHENELSFNKTFSNGIELIGITYECWGNRVIGNHAEGTGDNGISITGFDNLVVGNICRFNSNNGIHVYGNNNTVVGNNCKNNNQRFLSDGVSTFSGIEVGPAFGGACWDNTITGNICSDDQVVPTQTYGTHVQPNVMAQWATGVVTGVRAVVFNGTNAYIATSAGTTGVTAPVHTTGTVSDGGVNWLFLFGLHTDNTTLGAAGNALIGNTCVGNRIAPSLDDSQNNNSDIGGPDSMLRSIKNIPPNSNVTGVGGNMVLRRGVGQPWLAAYVNSGATTANRGLWQPVQIRALGLHSVRPSSGSVGSGFEGSQWYDLDEGRMVIAAGGARGGAWLDALSRQDPVTGVSAAGTGQSDATLLAYAHNTISTVAAGAGVKLPVITFPGEEMTVFNDGANNLLVYPSTGAQINALGANNPFTLPTGQAITFRTSSSTLWRTPALNVSTSGGVTPITHTVGNWYLPEDIRVTGTIAGSANQIRLFPFIANESITISQLGSFLVTGQAAANLQLAIYAADPTTHLPTGPALSSTASIAVAVANQGSVSAALGSNVALVKGNLYYLADNVDTASVSFTSLHSLGVIAAYAIGDATLSNVLNSQTDLGGYFFSQTFNTWPTFTGASSFTRAQGPSLVAIAFKVASVP